MNTSLRLCMRHMHPKLYIVKGPIASIIESYTEESSQYQDHAYSISTAAAKVVWGQQYTPQHCSQLDPLHGSKLNAKRNWGNHKTTSSSQEAKKQVRARCIRLGAREEHPMMATPACCAWRLRPCADEVSGAGWLGAPLAGIWSHPVSCTSMEGELAALNCLW